MTGVPEAESAENAWMKRLAAWIVTLVTAACWTYPSALLGLWLLMYAGGDRWWVATVLMYSPRWIWGLPLLLALPWVALRRDWRTGLPVTAASAFWLFLLMRLTISLPGGGGVRPGEQEVRVLTINLHRSTSSREAFAALIRSERPDVVAVQDWGDEFRGNLFPPDQWHTRRNGTQFLASRFRIRETENLNLDHLRGAPGTPLDDRSGKAVRYQLDAPFGPLHVYHVHLASPHGSFDRVQEQGWDAGPVVQANSEWRRKESALVRGRADAARAEAVLILGDFNTPLESPIYRDTWGGYDNAFSEAGNGFGFTYRIRRTQVRIDHILVGPGWRVAACRVGPHVGSPHRPVIAELRWRGR
jgi:vancomycin resistance protein VanJ